MPLLKTINKSHLIIQAEKFLDTCIKHVWFIVLELEQPFHLAASKEASLIKQTKNLLWLIFFHVSGVIWHTLYSYKYIQIITFITKILYTFTQLSKQTHIEICWICFSGANSDLVLKPHTGIVHIKDFVFNSLEYTNMRTPGQETAHPLTGLTLNKFWQKLWGF